MLENFLSYLLNNKLSSKSLKNYKSDLNHFYAWLNLELKKVGVFVNEIGEAIPFLDATTAEKFRNHLLDKHIPEKTINRRLSTLRQFSKFLVREEHIALDFMQSIQNISKNASKNINSKFDEIASNYAQHLKDLGISKNTLKNYMSDTKHFLNWIAQHNV